MLLNSQYNYLNDLLKISQKLKIYFNNLCNMHYMYDTF